MFSFKRNQSLEQFQEFINKVYGSTDDRLYSIWDLLTQNQRFVMRALKGIRQGGNKRLKSNLLISLAWLMAIANRLHINAQEEVWRRFPGACSYCGKRPCACKKIRPQKRAKILKIAYPKPKTLNELQKMFAKIYPQNPNGLSNAGVHLGEETGEISEAIHSYLGRHEQKHFDDIKYEVADFISCLFGVANAGKIDVADELAKMFYKNCHVCHKASCVCSFSEVVAIKT